MLVDAASRGRRRVPGAVHNDTSRAIILKFKHGNGLALTPVLAAMLGRLYDKLAAPGSLVIPVPLHRWRYPHRRHNQSAELTRRLTSTHPVAVYLAQTSCIAARQQPVRPASTTPSANQNLARAFQLNESGKAAEGTIIFC